jgi:HSP20 family protein
MEKWSRFEYVEADLQVRLIEERTMMTVTRIDPFTEFARLLADADGWVPPVDIYETEGRDLVLKVELPDMAREDIELTVEHNTLTLKGTRKRAADVKDEQFRRVERRSGPFSRSFALPNTVDASKVTADYKNGILTVKLPFREEARPRTIPVEVAA